MGKQVNYYMLPEDYPIISTYLAERDIIILSEPFTNDNLHERIRTGIEDRREGDQSRIILCKRKDLPNIKGKQLNPNVYYIKTLENPVVEFDRCHLDTAENHLGRGRIYYQTGYWDEDDDYIPKDEEFLQWANAFNAWLRRRVVNKKTPDKIKENISPAALRKIQEENLKIGM